MTKDQVLAILTQAGTRVSGESISRTLGLSRAAVNAAVRALRQEGYNISSSTKTGYCLLSGPDRLRPGELAARLGRERAADIICLDSVGSTNDYLKTLAQSGAPAGTVVLANAQTAGRGRLGRSFLSPTDQGVYLSLLLRPDCAPETCAQLTAWAAVAAIRAVESECGIRPGVKWVNDLILNGRKLGGILTEMSLEGESGRIQHAVLGLGLNVGQSAFPPELSPMATSLLMETGRRVSRCGIAAALIRELDKMCAEFPAERESYLAEYRGACLSLGRTLCFSLGGETVTGVAETVGEDFSLSVRLPDGDAVSLRSGEVSVRGLCGYL